MWALQGQLLLRGGYKAIFIQRVFFFLSTVTLFDYGKSWSVDFDFFSFFWIDFSFFKGRLFFLGTQLQISKLAVSN